MPSIPCALQHSIISVKYHPESADRADTSWSLLKDTQGKEQGNMRPPMLYPKIKLAANETAEEASHSKTLANRALR
eukprot:scaffold69969_cov31-Prasinocladus_malaysianus.AAC.1